VPSVEHLRKRPEDADTGVYFEKCVWCVFVPEPPLFTATVAVDVTAVVAE
jgi:hypothetical protein